MWWQWWWLCFTIDKSGNLEKECHQNKRLRSSKRSWIVADWNGGSHEEEETNENICCKCFVKCLDVFPTQVNQGRWIITGVRLQSNKLNPLARPCIPHVANDDEDDAGDEVDDDDDIDNYDHDADDTGGGIPSHSTKSWSCPEHGNGDDIIISIMGGRCLLR